MVRKKNKPVGKCGTFSSKIFIRWWNAFESCCHVFGAKNECFETISVTQSVIVAFDVTPTTTCSAVFIENDFSLSSNRFLTGAAVPRGRNIPKWPITRIHLQLLTTLLITL